MTNNTNTTFDYDDEANGPKALREHAKNLAKQNEELAAQFKSLNEQVRTRTVQDTLKAKGFDADKTAKVAKLVPEGGDVDQWLSEYGELFGLTTAEEPAANAAGASTPQTQEPQFGAGQQADPNAQLQAQFAAFQAAQGASTNVQTAGQADPMRAALEKAGQDGGAAGIANLLRAVGGAA